jgi:5'(3')-deoxyribonucleotidase
VEHLKRITFDVDNVLADSIACWCLKASTCLGYSVSKKDIKSHKIVGSIAMEAREIFRLQEQVWQEWEKLPPTDDNIPEKLLTLKERGFTIYVATSRPTRSVALVRNWIDQLGIPYDSFYSLGPYKAKVTIDSDILVDDAPEQIDRFIAEKRKGFIYDQPWNRNVDVPKAIVIHNLTELLSHLE